MEPHHPLNDLKAWFFRHMCVVQVGHSQLDDLLLQQVQAGASFIQAHCILNVVEVCRLCVAWPFERVAVKLLTLAGLKT